MSDIVMTDTELYDAKVNWFKEHDYVESRFHKCRLLFEDIVKLGD